MTTAVVIRVNCFSAIVNIAWQIFCSFRFENSILSQILHMYSLQYFVDLLNITQHGQIYNTV